MHPDNISKHGNEIRFSTITPNGEENIKYIRQTDIQACRFYIMVPEHYREDGSCKCDNSNEREMMIRDWGYSEEDFDGIPLREGKDA